MIRHRAQQLLRVTRPYRVFLKRARHWIGKITRYVPVSRAGVRRVEDDPRLRLGMYESETSENDGCTGRRVVTTTRTAIIIWLFSGIFRCPYLGYRSTIWPVLFDLPRPRDYPYAA